MPMSFLRSRPHSGWAWFSLLVGSCAVLIQLLYYGVLLASSIASGGEIHSSVGGLGVAFGYAALPLICIALAANVGGVVVGLIGLSKAEDGDERRWCILGAALNMVSPMLLCWLGAASSQLLDLMHIGGG